MTFAPLDYYRSLIADETRTAAYAEAIRAVVRPGDVVVDLGTGTGILALLAQQAGARRVFAIERTHAADAARLVAAGRIEVFHNHSTEVELPERGDVLVTETIGMLGFDEGIAGSVVDARRRLLRDGATIVPHALATWLAPVSLPDAWGTHVGWWSESRHGVDLAPLRKFAEHAIYPLHIGREALVAAPAEVLRAELGSLETTHVAGRASFTLDRDATIHGFAAWFHADLLGERPVRARDRFAAVTNAPGAGTHWQQAFLPLPHPRAMRRGDTLDLALDSYDGTRWRWRGDGFDQTTAFARPVCTLAMEKGSE